MLATSSRSVAETPAEAEPRLALTTAEVRQVWALYSRPLPEVHSATPPGSAGAPVPISAWLGDLLPLAWKSRRTLAQSVAAALALGVIFLFSVPPTFGVSALVLVESRSAGAQGGAADPGASGFLAGQAEILAGPALVRDALDRSGPGEVGRETLATALDAFSAKPVSGTQVIALEYRTQDPAAGVRFVRAVIDSYAEFARSLGRGEVGVAVRTLAAPARPASPLWPRPLPVLFACVLLGLLAGLALALRARRGAAPEPGWTEIREAAWAA